jgi:hypothetical protein
VRSAAEERVARAAGAHPVLLNDQALPERVKALAPDGVDHIGVRFWLMGFKNIRVYSSGVPISR